MEAGARRAERPEGGGAPVADAHVWDLFLDDDPGAPSTGAPAARTGAANMALDHLLLERVRAGGRPALRFYCWSPPCLSLGRNQPARGLLDPEHARARGIDIVRRPTGGLAVLHHLEVTYAAALPVGLLGTPRETYRALSRALAAGLRLLGAPAVLVGEETPPSTMPTLPPGYLAGAALEARCFGSAAPGEIAAASRKLVGSAQRREGRALLQHGSILLAGDQGPVLELFGGDRAAAARAGALARPTSLAEVLGETPRPAAVIRALSRAFEDVLGIGLAPASPGSEGGARLAQLEARYRSRAWTWRC